MTRFANAHRVTSKIKVGDWVYLTIRPHRPSSMPTRLHPTLETRYYGHYKVIRQIGVAAFKLQILVQARIHPIFHVSHLKLAIEDHPVEAELPVGLQDHSTGL